MGGGKLDWIGWRFGGLVLFVVAARDRRWERRRALLEVIDFTSSRTFSPFERDEVRGERVDQDRDLN